MKSIDHLLLTGGTGFFGKALLRLIHTSSDRPRVTILSRNPQRFITHHPEFESLAEWAIGDITKVDTLRLKGPFSHIIHAAYDVSQEQTLEPALERNQIVTGTRNILKLAVESKTAKFLFVSSGAIYGPQPLTLDKVPESYAQNSEILKNRDLYGLSKYKAERLCIEYGARYKFAVVIARCFAFIGIDMPIDARYAVGNFIRDAIFNTEIRVNGPRNVVRSYLDQRDLAKWLFRLLTDGRPGQAYNVGSDQSITLESLAKTVRDLLAPGKPIRFVSPIDAKMPARARYVPDISLVKNELNLTVNVPLTEAICQVGKYLTDNSPAKNIGSK